MGAAGRARFEREFDNRIAARRLVALFERVIDDGGHEDVDPGTARAAVETGLAEIIGQLTEVPHPDAAAAELVEPTAFPQDLLAEMTRLQDVSDEEFVLGAYRAILQREADDEGVEHAIAGLSTRARSRDDLVAEMATGDEARRIGVDPAFLDRLDLLQPSELERRLRDAFWRDDDTFAAALVDVLLRNHTAEERDAARPEVGRALAAGRPRAEILRELIERHRLVARRPGLAAVAEEEFLTTAQLEARLADMAGLDDPGFATGAYRLLLGREPEPAGLSDTLKRLAGEPRRRVLFDVAASAEATGRGIDPHVVDAAAARVPALGDGPDGGRVDRLKRVGKKVVRATGPAGVARSVDEHSRRTDAALRQLTELTASSGEAAARSAADADARLGRLEDRAAALEAQLDAAHREQQRTLAGMQQWIEGIAQRVADFPPEGVHGAYLGDGRMLVRTIWGGRLVVPADDLSLTPELVAEGIYEAPFSRYLLRHLERGQTVVDVGANVGLFTVLMASRVDAEGHVIAYEPSPDVLPVLRENIALNWISERVTLRASAAGAASGSMALHVTERFRANSSLLEPDDAYFEHVPMDTVRRVDVAVEPLDDLLGAHDRLHFVKIDVEGAEHLVFEGMEGWLERGTVDRIAFEVYAERMGDAWSGFCDRLRALSASGWGFFVLEDDGTPAPVGVEHVIAVGRFSQVLIQRP